MLCTSCGGGTQLADGSYVYLVVTQFNRTWIGEGDQRKEAPVSPFTIRAACDL